MKLPVDTSAIAFLCAVEAEPVVHFETKRPRADENGEPLYLVQLIAMTDGAAEILAVKVPGMPSGLRQGHPVKGHRPGRPALEHERPLRGRVPRGPGRAGRGPGQGQLAERRCAQATVREGTGAAASEPRSPPPTRPGASTPGPCIRKWSP